MEITNKPRLSKCWITAVSKDEHEHMGDRSMTEILNPVRIYQLVKRHFDEITEDVSDGIWKLLGKAVHYVLEQASDAAAITEQRFNVQVGEYSLSVCPDRVEKLSLDRCKKYWNPNITEPVFACGRFEYPVGTQLYALRDFKITQVYARNMLVKEGKGDWRWQINGYAWALRQTGFPIVEASLEILMKDWDWMEANVKRTYGYPPYQVESIPIDLYNDDEVVAFLQKRMDLHMTYDKVPDDELPFCTLDERWATVDRFAVKRTGGDKAMSGGSKFLTRADADQFVDMAILKASQKKGKTAEFLTKADFEVEFRKGESKRCERYCPVKNFCNQYSTQVSPPF